MIIYLEKGQILTMAEPELRCAMKHRRTWHVQQSGLKSTGVAGMKEWGKKRKKKSASDWFELCGVLQLSDTKGTHLFELWLHIWRFHVASGPTWNKQSIVSFDRWDQVSLPINPTDLADTESPDWNKKPVCWARVVRLRIAEWQCDTREKTTPPNYIIQEK